MATVLFDIVVIKYTQKGLIMPLYEKEYIQILDQELLVSLGCTEPIAIALATARARELLGCVPDKMIISCSGNIIKNVKGVIVPNSNGHKGVEVAAVLGALGGDASCELEVLSSITNEDRKECKRLLSSPGFCEVRLVKGEENLYIQAQLFAGEKSSSVLLKTSHTNIVREELNGEVLLEKSNTHEEHLARKDLLDFRHIYDFALGVDLDLVKDLINCQMKYNWAIAKEGLAKPWGACVGRTLQKTYASNIKTKAKALAAAGSDARMNGCLLPVVINSGSGNQGITVCVPVMAYAKELHSSNEQLLRALVFANLIAIYLKSGIGKLSAYCGVVSAAVAALAGVGMLKKLSYDTICMGIINTLANDSGIICDGAKSSCAAKIATALDAAILGHFMAIEGIVFKDGDGLVRGDIEDTLANISRLGKIGMKGTDEEILSMMIGC